MNLIYFKIKLIFTLSRYVRVLQLVEHIRFFLINKHKQNNS